MQRAERPDLPQGVRHTAASDADGTPCGHDPGRLNRSLEVLLRYSNFTIGKNLAALFDNPDTFIDSTTVERPRRQKIEDRLGSETVAQLLAQYEAGATTA